MIRLRGDFACIKAHKADKNGNLVFHSTAQNFNPDCAKAAKITIAEVEEIVEVGELKPDEIHLPGCEDNQLIFPFYLAELAMARRNFIHYDSTESAFTTESISFMPH